MSRNRHRKTKSNEDIIELLDHTPLPKVKPENRYRAVFVRPNIQNICE